MRKYFFITFLCLFHFNSFNQTIDYSNLENWSVNPIKFSYQNFFNLKFTVINKDNNIEQTFNIQIDTISNIDLFCVHPTVFVELLSKPHNVKMTDEYKKQVDSVMKYCFVYFTQFGRIFAPYYHQASLTAFVDKGLFVSSDSMVAEIFENAFNDIFSAFDYYMQNFNNGRKVILVGYSQGSYLLSMLLHKFESNPEFYKLFSEKILFAILVGMPGGLFAEKNKLSGGWWKNISVCDNIDNKFCIISWETYLDKGKGLNDIIKNNRIIKNKYLVKKELMYSIFDSEKFDILSKRTNISPYKTVKYSAFPNNQIYFGKKRYTIDSDFIVYENMYEYKTNGIGMFVKKKFVEDDKRIDPLVQARTENLHIYDMFIMIGDMMDLIKEKINLTK